MNVAFPWFVLIAYQSYQHGYKQNQFPPPYYFIGATVAMGLVAVVGEANQTFGTVLAWGLVAGAFVAGSFKTVPANSETPTGNPSSNNTGAVGSGGGGNFVI